MIIDMNEDFLIRLNYVETSEPDRVAKELQQQDQRIAELESALLKAVDSCLQYEKGENIKFTKEELQIKAKEFTNFSIKLDNIGNQTAVKEFAEEFKKLCFNYGEFDDILCYRNNACELIDRLLKERGIE